MSLSLHGCTRGGIIGPEFPVAYGPPLCAYRLPGLTRALARYMLHWRWGPPDGPVSITCQDPHSKAVLTTKDFPDQEAALKWVLEDYDGESPTWTRTTWHVPGM